MKTKYLHLRAIDPNAPVITTLPKGGMTVAYIIDDNKMVLGFAMAKCHKNDTYNKYLGRVKSTGRLKSSAYFTETHTEEQEFIQKMHDFWKEEQDMVPDFLTPGNS